MRTELINTLLKAGIVDEKAVTAAMEHEFGTSLVERLLTLGYGSEEDVFKVIKNKLKLEVVGKDELFNVNPAVLKMVPKGIVERHHFMPFHEDGTKIHIAMFYPTQDPCLNEIFFFTHLRVIPYGTLASDLTKALNKYYGLSLPELFKHKKPERIPNTDDLTPPPPPNFPLPNKKPELTPITDPNIPPLPKLDSTDDIGVFDISSEQEDFRDISNTNVRIDMPDSVPEFEVVEDTKLSENNRSVFIPKDVDVSNIEKADSKDSILNAVTEQLQNVSEAGLVLFVKEDYMVGVKGFGEHMQGEVEDYKVSLSAPNMFQWVFENKKEFHGQAQGGYLNDMFFKRFGSFIPEHLAIVPVSIENEVFACIYCQSPSSIDEVKNIAAAMALSFDRLLNSL